MVKVLQSGQPSSLGHTKAEFPLVLLCFWLIFMAAFFAAFFLSFFFFHIALNDKLTKTAQGCVLERFLCFCIFKTEAAPVEIGTHIFFHWKLWKKPRLHFQCVCKMHKKRGQWKHTLKDSMSNEWMCTREDRSSSGWRGIRKWSNLLWHLSALLT